MFPVRLSREFLEQELSKLQKKTYNQFQWWRRYQTRKTLHEKKPLEERILNGDYEHSDYYYQAMYENYLLEDKIKDIKYYESKLNDISLFRTRYKRLMDDYEKDEKELIKNLRRDFRVVFRITYEELDEIMANFDGTTHELYLHVKELMRKRRQDEYNQVSQ
jgi:predicted MPP superfamily phosphohydrolase